jgi:protease I
MEKKLNNHKIAIIVTNGFEESEFSKPYDAIKSAGGIPVVISIKNKKIKSWSDKNWGKEYDADKLIDEVSSNDFDALVLPGGVMNPDQLRTNEKVVSFVKDFLIEGKPVAAICHGPWTLIETGLISGRTVTSWPSLKTDLTNAGAHWVDREVVVDNGLVTSRKPADLPAFCEKMIEEISEGTHKHVS